MTKTSRALLALPIVLPLLLTCSAAKALAPCVLAAPATATSGKLFRLSWNMGQAGSGTVTRGDGLVVATSSTQVGGAHAFATNVLGPHTYTLLVTSNGETTSCTAQVNFVYTPAAVSGYDIIIIAGQSNAVGQGNGPFSDRNAKAPIDSRIVQIGRIGASNMQVIPVGYREDGILHDGLHHWLVPERDLLEGFGLTFARLYVRYRLEPGRNVMLIPAGYGGRSIRYWMDGSSLPLYPDMMDRIAAARALPGDNRIVAFLWQQGASDVVATYEHDPEMNPEIYRQDLTEVMGKVRTDLGLPQLPITAGHFVPSWLAGNPTRSAIKHQFEQVITDVMSAIGSARVVSSNGLTSNADIGVPTGTGHFNAASQVIFGQRYYKSWSNIVASQASQ